MRNPIFSDRFFPLSDFLGDGNWIHALGSFQKLVLKRKEEEEEKKVSPRVVIWYFKSIFDNIEGNKLTAWNFSFFSFPFRFEQTVFRCVPPQITINKRFVPAPTLLINSFDGITGSADAIRRPAAWHSESRQKGAQACTRKLKINCLYYAIEYSPKYL